VSRNRVTRCVWEKKLTKNVAQPIENVVQPIKNAFYITVFVNDTSY
jgi:hypothetical protein